MRVIAGRARGRTLAAPRGRRTRPTSDRVREAVFNMLGSLGGVEGARVLDLFCGSGAMGVEALSRGAAQVTFVDNDRDAAAAVRANLQVVGGGAAEVVVADALRWIGGTSSSWDLAICDPPYAFDQWDELLAALPARLVVLESDRPLAAGPGWDVLKSRRHGGTVVTLAQQAPHGEKRPA